MAYRLVIAAVAATVSVAALAQQGESVEQRVVETMRRAAAQGPDAEILAASAAAEASGWRADTRLDAPRIALQREGFKGFFENQVNSVWYVRLSTPVGIGRGGTRADLADQIDRWLGVQTRAGRLQTAATAARLWLESAAQHDRIAVLERRVERLGAALEIERTRYEVGEVSGYAVTQFELQWVNDRAALRQRGARLAAIDSGLRAVVGGDHPAPRAGDLDVLARSVEPAEAGAPVFAQLDVIPFVAAARERADAQSRWGEWVGSTSRGLPEFALEYEHLPSVDGQPAANAWGFMVSFPLPIGDQATVRTEAAAARTRVARAEEARVRGEVRARLESALARSAATREALAEIEPMLARVPEIERSLREQFRLGTMTYLAYIDGLGRLDDLLLNHVDLQLELLLAQLEAAAVLDNATLFPLPAEGAQ
jgi:outer membrane protein TolC